MADIGGKSYQEWMNEIQRQGDTTKGGSVEAEQAARAAYASAANAMTPQSSNQSGFGAVNFNPAHFKLNAVLAVARELAYFFLEQIGALGVAGQLKGNGIG